MYVITKIDPKSQLLFPVPKQIDTVKIDKI